METQDWEGKWLIVLLKKTHFVSFDHKNSFTVLPLISKQVVLTLSRNLLFKCWIYFSLQNWIGPHRLSFGKTVSMNIWVIIKFISPEVALYFYKSTILLCMGYYCHVKNNARCYMGILCNHWSCNCFSFREAVAHFQNLTSFFIIHVGGLHDFPQIFMNIQKPFLFVQKVYTNSFFPPRTTL